MVIYNEAKEIKATGELSDVVTSTYQSVRYSPHEFTDGSKSASVPRCSCPCK